jgi:hypothetical protein
VLFYVKLGELITMNPVKEKRKEKILMQTNKQKMQTYQKKKKEKKID